MFADGKYDLVVHFAGLKAVAESIEQPLKYYEEKVGGTINLLKCMDEYNVKNSVFVFGDSIWRTTKSKIKRK